jgi:hypothetical protein
VAEEHAVPEPHGTASLETDTRRKRQQPQTEDAEDLAPALLFAAALVVAEHARHDGTLGEQ